LLHRLQQGLLLATHFVKLVYATHALIAQHKRTSF
jgi:hypothetical protein